MDVSAVVRAQLPGYVVESIVELGSGLDNVAFEVNGSLIVRFAREPGAADREARLLAVVSEFTTLPVPAPVFASPDCLAYPKLPGVPLLAVPDHHASALAPVLHRFLQALHRIPPARLDGTTEVDDAAPTEWRAEAAEYYDATRAEIPTAFHRPIETFLTTPVPAATETLVFSHNDLGIEHVLIDPSSWTVTGVIDWTDAAVVDPAVDIGRLYRDLGSPTLTGWPDDLRERAVFYARCGVLEDLRFGLDHSREAYVHKALGALRWLFPTG